MTATSAEHTANFVDELQDWLGANFGSEGWWPNHELTDAVAREAAVARLVKRGLS